MRSHNKPGKPQKVENKKEIEKVPEEIPITHNIPQMIQPTPPIIPQYQPQPQPVFQQQKPVKKTPYIIPELISSDSSVKNLPSCQQQQNYTQQLLPEALNPMNLISNTPTNNSNYSTSSLLLPPLPTHSHETTEHHHFSNHFESGTYLPPTPNILPNSYFIMGGLDFSKNNSLNGEPTYIDY